MSVALLDRTSPSVRDGAWADAGEAVRHQAKEPVALQAGQRPTLGAPRVGERAVRTLDECVVTAWDGLLADAFVDCPVCRGKMLLRCGAMASDNGSPGMPATLGGSSEARAGDCLDCGATLD